jgi:hypothetical protein
MPPLAAKCAGPQGTSAVSGARDNRAVKLRRLRENDVLEDGNVVLVRGGELDPDVLRADALRYHSIYGTHGISVFAVRGATLDEMAQEVPLIRFERLTLLKVSEVIEARLRLEPTGRNPRHYTIGFDDLDDGVRRLAGCQHRTVPNPYHDA